MNPPRILSIGETLSYSLPGGCRLGGAPVTFAYHLSRLGKATMLISAVGDDQLGREVLHRLSAAGVDHSMQVVRGHPTGEATVTLGHMDKHQYDICADAAWDYLDVTSGLLATATGCEAVFWNSLPLRNAPARDAVLRLVRAAPQESARIFDMNLRQHFYSEEVILESLLACNVLKADKFEFSYLEQLLDLSSKSYFDRRFELMEKFDIRTMLISSGPLGSYVYRQGVVSEVQPRLFHGVDRVDIGSVLTAAFYAFLREGVPFSICHKQASEYTASVCAPLRNFL